MMNSIEIHNQCANSYDDDIHNYRAYIAEVLFGLSYEYINSNQKLLDLGIGTGLSSLPFAKAGLTIFGVDGSSEMLKICSSRNIAKELLQADINQLPLQYENNFFDHIVSCGIFHFFENVKPLFEEVNRLLKPGGIFLFTIGTLLKGKENFVVRIESGIRVFNHSETYIEKLLAITGFKVVKNIRVQFGKRNEITNTAYVTKKL